MNVRLDEPTLDDKKLVFLGGLHRSGKSLLLRCLTDHPGVSGLYNDDVNGQHRQDEGQHVQSVYPPAAAFGGAGEFGSDPDAHLDETSDLATRDHARRLFAEWRPYWDLDKPILAENSPPNLLRTRFLQSLFPNTHFVIVLRHPIPVSYETMAWSADRIDNQIEHWLVAHERLAEDAAHVHNLLLVKYERFVTRPNSTLDRIFRFLDLDPCAPDREIRTGENEKHFRRWYEAPLNRYNTVPIPRLFRTYCYRFERRLNRFGYSLRDPHDVQPAAHPLLAEAERGPANGTSREDPSKHPDQKPPA